MRFTDHCGSPRSLTCDVMTQQATLKASFMSPIADARKATLVPPLSLSFVIFVFLNLSHHGKHNAHGPRRNTQPESACAAALDTHTDIAHTHCPPTAADPSSQTHHGHDSSSSPACNPGAASEYRIRLARLCWSCSCCSASGRCLPQQGTEGT